MRLLVKWGAAALGAGAAVYLGAVVALYADATSHPADNADAAVVYGNTVHPDGTPSDRLKARLDAAHGLLVAGAVKRIVVSGALGQEGHDEAVVMGRYLQGRGVPPSQLLVDSQGWTTEATSRNAAALLGPQAVVVAVSQRFHVSRAKMSLRHAGFTHVQGAPAQYTELRDAYAYTREVPAWLSYWWRGR